MPVDLPAAERFILANARVLERHRLAVLEQIGQLGDPMTADAAVWIGGIVDAGGGVPFVLPEAALSPHAPWMVPTVGGSQLAFGLVAAGARAGLDAPWLERATEWCWARIARADELDAYLVRYALAFLDAVPDASRAAAAIEQVGARIGDDWTMRVAGGTADERLTPLSFSPRPGSRSRVLLDDDQIADELDALEAAQLDDGGWGFDWLAWSDGQSVEWRGIVTLLALATLADHGRLIRQAVC